MRQYENIFTDAVKDVIGNDPVLDQFDISYEASFYGSMQDDYITGSIFSSTTSVNSRNKISTGSRGRAFSKYFAESAPPLDSTYGSIEVGKNPSLAYRLVPWYERASSTAYRLTQAFDDSERYYDSCLPDFNNCLAANGVKPWIITNESETLLSPYNNVIMASSVANLVFNYHMKDRESEGYESDPAVDNIWTWSYPYENRYKPETRMLSMNEALSLKPISLAAKIKLISPLDIYPRLGQFWETSGSVGFVIEDITTVNLNQSRREVKNFRAILPGRIPQDSTGFTGRNSLRQDTTSAYSGSNGYRSIIPTSYKDSTLDSTYGYSLLIPADVILSSRADHGFLTNYSVANPGDEFLTSSMYLSDTVKFLFGFGDLNTMTYSSRSVFDPSKVRLDYEEGFENNTDGEPSTSIAPHNSGLLKLNWATAGYPNSNRWKVATQQGTTGSQFYFSGMGSYAGDSTTGVSWDSDITAGGFNILYSNTTTDLSGNIDALGGDSYMHLDITSSCPWSFGFNFSIVSDGVGDYFIADLTGSWANGPVGLLNTSDWGAPDAFFYVSEDGSKGLTVTQTNLPGVINDTSPRLSRSGGTWSWDTYGAKDIGLGESYFTGSNSYPIPAGEYRLIFQYRYAGLGTPTVSFAAVDRMQFRIYDEECFPIDTSSKIIGGNNYPDFRIKDSDARANPTYKFGVPVGWADDTSWLQERTADIYSGIVYGLSPVIRGWKYGLYSGLPMNSKSIFRRGKFGQFRDMLEQRQYTKFVNTGISPLDNEAIVYDIFNKQLDSSLTSSPATSTIGPAVVDVDFVRRKYELVGARGIGRIYNERVDPSHTTSHNLSTHVTSSVPYVEGQVYSDLFSQFRNSTLTSIQFDPSGISVGSGLYTGPMRT